MPRKTLLTLAVLTALTAGSTFAATQSDATPKPQWASLDTNQDGAIDRAEAAAMPRLAERFDTLDKNKDGRLAQEEMPRRGDGKHGKRGERGGQHAMMARLDTDRDGRISLAEATVGEGKSAERFAKMDVNSDGFVDRADHQLRAKQRNDAWFASTDTDNNGQLSRAEYDAGQAKRWEDRGARGAGWGEKSGQ